ncbi:MAG TPA: hypothetical protein VH352_01000, partial [Pseudonocardiaceae bacterium]|nr:hypothetical protein [Pseudonocardiaceae bacterium]
VLAVVLLPLHVIGEPADGPAVSVPALVRFGALFGVAALATGAVLWSVVTALPTQPARPYLQFALAGSYAKVTGTVPVAVGQVLRVPVSVSGDTGGLAVQSKINGAAGSPVPVVAGGAEVRVTAPAGCLSQLSLVLVKGKTELRSVDLYLSSCAHG